MKPTTFPQAIKTLMPPSGVANHVKQMPVYTNGETVVSRWKPTFADRLRILFGAPVWLGVLSGDTQPPVWLDTENPFAEPKPTTKIENIWYNIKDFFTETWALLRDGFGQSDKRKHFIIGMVISWVCGFIWHICGLPMACTFGFLMGACAGMVKEWWDSRGHGCVEVMDFVFTALGAFVAMGLTALFYLIL